MPLIIIPAKNMKITAEAGESLLATLQQHGIYPDAPCGGNGTCGKCLVSVDGKKALACKTIVDRDMTVELPQTGSVPVPHDGFCKVQPIDPIRSGPMLAFDIGTTSVVCFLLDGKSGAELSKSSMLNPQIAFGADVITRIQTARHGSFDLLTESIREAMTELIRTVCAEADVSPDAIGVVSVVGNPAMQQLFLHVDPENLGRVPFDPVLTQAQTVPCREILPICPNAFILIVPDISGFVGADTIGCILAAESFDTEEITLLVDIGTNSEMVLGNKSHMIACAAAAGPALEGANIYFGMRAAAGAVDHVWSENGEIRFSVIGSEPAKGICGSGLIDAVATGLRTGLINKRGRILTEDRILRLTDNIYLTQEDIRQVQLAKGAISAGITLMTDKLGLKLEDIQKVQLAGAFGSFLRPENACRIGMLPERLLDRIEVINNAAVSGAKRLACDKALLPLSQKLAEKIEFLELASMESFPRTFARAMLFQEES